MKEVEKGKSKTIGQIFTPQFIVEEMLDYIGYNGCGIFGKHIIDNSCGDGAFLKVIVSRYCSEALKQGKLPNTIKSELEKYIHGIDNDKQAFIQCEQNLDQIALSYGISGVKWDLYNQSSLSMKDFDGMMDYVIGNPPYVRVHNLDDTYEEVKRYRFANGGMTDLYLAFFELGFNMLNNKGLLCYITPSSWLNSVAALNLRQYILRERNLVSLTDLEHFQAFDNATTYTLISLFAKNNKKKSFDYFIFNGQTHKREFIDTISVDDCYINSYFYLADKKQLQLVRDIKTKPSKKYVSVKNGFATLADDVFIGEDIPNSNITIKALKASTGKWYNCLFPYDKKGKLLPPEIALSSPSVKQHFILHKQDILKGKKDYPSFYEYGRTQAIQDVWKDKIAINALIRTESDLKIEVVKAGQGVYSGLYIINNDVIIPFEDIIGLLTTKDFAKYVSLLKKYKSGGYYTYNSKDVEQYVNYMLTFKSNKNYDDQPRLFEHNLRLF